MYLNLKIKHWRIIKNFTQAELAKKTEIDQSYISILESNHRKKSPTLKMLENLAKTLEICPLELIECECEHCKKNSMG